MTLRASNQQVALDATCLVTYKGEPNVTVAWASTSGTIEPLRNFTDANGVAAAKFTPAELGPVDITVLHGA
jgi:hypothetical protein